MFRYIHPIGPREGVFLGIKPVDGVLPRETDNGCDGQGFFIEGHGGG